MMFSELSIGQSYEIKRTFTNKEITAFAELSLDNNPLHTNPEFAKQSIFGQMIVPGFLTASLFSAIIGTKFPGFGSIYLNQNLTFLKPVFPNQEVTAVVSVKELFTEKQRILLDTICYDQLGNKVIVGTALIKIK